MSADMWRTADGWVRVEQMSESHILNAAIWLRGRTKEQLEEQIFQADSDQHNKLKPPAFYFAGLPEGAYLSVAYPASNAVFERERVILQRQAKEKARNPFERIAYVGAHEHKVPLQTRRSRRNPNSRFDGVDVDQELDMYGMMGMNGQ